ASCTVTCPRPTPTEEQVSTLSTPPRSPCVCPSVFVFLTQGRNEHTRPAGSEVQQARPSPGVGAAVCVTYHERFIGVETPLDRGERSLGGGGKRVSHTRACAGRRTPRLNRDSSLSHASRPRP
ncbi:unnamed protein product, partial [Ectocarpus sp. 6 AP-2014]